MGVSGLSENHTRQNIVAFEHQKKPPHNSEHNGLLVGKQTDEKFSPIIHH